MTWKTEYQIHKENKKEVLNKWKNHSREENGKHGMRNLKESLPTVRHFYGLPTVTWDLRLVTSNLTLTEKAIEMQPPNSQITQTLALH